MISKSSNVVPRYCVYDIRFDAWLYLEKYNHTSFTGKFNEYDFRWVISDKKNRDNHKMAVFYDHRDARQYALAFIKRTISKSFAVVAAYPLMFDWSQDHSMIPYNINSLKFDFACSEVYIPGEDF